MWCFLKDQCMSGLDCQQKGGVTRIRQGSGNRRPLCSTPFNPAVLSAGGTELTYVFVMCQIKFGRLFYNMVQFQELDSTLHTCTSVEGKSF